MTATARIICLSFFRATGGRMPPIDLIPPRLLPGDRARCTSSWRTGFILKLLPNERAQLVLNNGAGMLICPESQLARINPQEKFA